MQIHNLKKHEIYIASINIKKNYKHSVYYLYILYIMTI